MTTIKSIPTEYNGIMYRSKLEAKWAAYFDLCGASFQYEPQAFDLGDGVKYLPDFCVKNVLSVHGGCGDQTLDNSLCYPEFWFECKGVMSDYDGKKVNLFREAIKIEDDNPECWGRYPFYVLYDSPLKMFNMFENITYDYTFYSIDGDEFPLVIGKQFGRNGIGFFGCDSNYTSLMDKNSIKFARQVETMFRWNCGN